MSCPRLLLVFPLILAACSNSNSGGVPSRTAAEAAVDAVVHARAQQEWTERYGPPRAVAIAEASRLDETTAESSPERPAAIRRAAEAVVARELGPPPPADPRRKGKPQPDPQAAERERRVQAAEAEIIKALEVRRQDRQRQAYLARAAQAEAVCRARAQMAFNSHPSIGRSLLELDAHLASRQAFRLCADLFLRHGVMPTF